MLNLQFLPEFPFSTSRQCWNWQPWFDCSRVLTFANKYGYVLCLLRPIIFALGNKQQNSPTTIVLAHATSTENTVEGGSGSLSTAAKRRFHYIETPAKRVKELIALIEQTPFHEVQGIHASCFQALTELRCAPYGADQFFRFPFPSSMRYQYGSFHLEARIPERGISGEIMMTKHHPSRWRKPQDRITRRYDLNQMLDILLAFDQSVVECSMRLYNVPRRDRVTMREQNRRLHHALRECLPRLLEPKPTFLPKAVRA